MTAPTVSPFTATVDGERLRRYAELAAQGPVVRVVLPTGMAAWVVTGYAAVRQALNDPRLHKAPTPLARLVAQVRPQHLPFLTSHLLTTDGPDHARRRRLVTAAFTRRAVEGLEPRIRELAVSLLDELGAEGPDAVVDLHAGYAYPLPMAVICDLMGIPPEYRERFHDLTEAAFTRGMFSPLEELAVTFDDYLDLIRTVIEVKRAEPDDALISALVAARDGGDRLSEQELTSMVIMLVVAGHETTANLLANGTAALFAFPDQKARLVADPALIPSAVEELLRFASPVQSTFPVVAAEDVELAGVTIPVGEVILPSPLAANRDPAHVEDPDALDVSRTPNSHLGLGHGPHHCLGAPLARLEARIGFETLLGRHPDLSLAVDPAELTWQPNVLFHALAALPVRLGKPA